MTREEIMADLSYARTLAEEGRQAPLIGGRYLVLFGGLLCVLLTPGLIMIRAEPSTTV